jgi:CheY-like chemotaxis protein
MKERILLVGEDSHLLATRALLLSDWEIETVNSYDAMDRIRAGAFDLVIVGHTIPELGAKMLIWRIKDLRPPPEILAIRIAVGDDDLEVETHISDLYESPGWLRKRVSEILTGRKESAYSAVEHRPASCGDATADG